MDGQIILIVGISGFIGNHLGKFLKSTYPNCKIIGICRNIKPEILDFDAYEINLANENDILEFLLKIKPNYIFHLAGKTFSYDWNELYKDNVTITVNLLEALKKSKLVSRIVIAGSSAEYGNIPSEQLPVTEASAPLPLNPYGITKLCQTLTAKYYASNDLHICIGRIFNIIGNCISPRLTIGSYLTQIHSILKGTQDPRILVGNLETRRDFLDIDDVCSALIAIAKQGKNGNIYNICSGFSIANKVILDLLIASAKMTASIVFDENEIRNMAVQDIYGSNLKIKADTSWEPTTSIEDSIKKALN